MLSAATLASGGVDDIDDDTEPRPSSPSSFTPNGGSIDEKVFCVTSTLHSQMRFAFAYILFFLSSLTLCAQPWSDPDSNRFVLRNMTEINSAADDYAPCMTPSRSWLYFTSSRNGGIAKVHRAAREEGGWGEGTLLVDTVIGDTLGDDGALAITFPFLAQLFPLTANDMKDIDFVGMGTFTSGRRPGVIADADLYLVRVGLNQIDMAERNPLPFISSDDWEAQGAITPDGRMLVFASDRAGGGGGMDLWLSVRDRNGEYGAPVNLGPTINTPGNEFSPSFAPDGVTLYFASTGHEGFGGSDLFVTRFSMVEKRLQPPVNLGPRINTTANEAFFFSAGRERCFFVSDRPGGKGGLDIYEGTPNIFVTGYSRVLLSITDTTLGTSAWGRLRIVEPVLGRTIAELDVDPRAPTEIPLPGGGDYRIEAMVPGIEPTIVVLKDLPTDTTYRFVVKLGSPPPPPEMVFTIDGVDVPLFVSGYYRINTQISLDDLRRRQNGDLKRLTYIESVVRDTSVYTGYQQMAGRVQGILDDFYHRCVDQYFPGYAQVKRPNEKLEILVYGYADPRPIIGRYQEKSITFYDSSRGAHQVRTGAKLDNFKLAGLRAFYAVEYLDARFRQAAAEGNDEYLRLMREGVIRWIPISGNVDDYSGGDDLAQKRRIKLVFKRVGAE